MSPTPLLLSCQAPCWPCIGLALGAWELVSFGPSWWAMSLGFRGFGTGIKSLPLGVDTERLTDHFKEACGLFGGCQLKGCSIHAGPLAPTAQKLTSAFLLDSLCPNPRSLIDHLYVTSKILDFSVTLWPHSIHFHLFHMIIGSYTIPLKVIREVSGYWENIICQFCYLINPTTFWN